MGIGMTTSQGAPEQAAEAAERAIARSGVEVRRLEDIGAIQAAVALLTDIWGPGDLIGVATLKAMAHSDNYVFGAFLGPEMVGAIVGFVGLTDDGEIQLHSHILGVASSAQGRNVGFALKEHQRSWALAREIKTITWTYDPLVCRNAYFNISKLGASVTDYYTDFYGRMEDGINGGDETDRALAVWHLESDRAISASLGSAPGPNAEELRQAGAEILLEVGEGESPIERPATSNRLLVGLPRDIVDLRQRDPELARRWRLALRDALGGALNNGHVTTALVQPGFYLLERATPTGA
jgi:predicted GNAT superfamily acetyltransferase